MCSQATRTHLLVSLFSIDLVTQTTLGVDENERMRIGERSACTGGVQKARSSEVGCKSCACEFKWMFGCDRRQAPRMTGFEVLQQLHTSAPSQSRNALQMR